VWTRASEHAQAYIKSFLFCNSSIIANQLVIIPVSACNAASSNSNSAWRPSKNMAASILPIQ